MAEVVDLAVEWGGKTSHADGAVHRVDYLLLDSTVTDDEMACSGREALDRHIRRVEKSRNAQTCGSCAVKKSCLIGIHF